MLLMMSGEGALGALSAQSHPPTQAAQCVTAAIKEMVRCPSLPAQQNAPPTNLSELLFRVVANHCGGSRGFQIRTVFRTVAGVEPKTLEWILKTRTNLQMQSLHVI